MFLLCVFLFFLFFVVFFFVFFFCFFSILFQHKKGNGAFLVECFDIKTKLKKLKFIAKKRRKKIGTNYSDFSKNLNRSFNQQFNQYLIFSIDSSITVIVQWMIPHGCGPKLFVLLSNLIAKSQFKAFIKHQLTQYNTIQCNYL